MQPAAPSKQQEIVGGILVRVGVIRVADVAAHRQAEQFAHEMIFEAGANDLPLVVEIFRADEADDAIHQKRIEASRDAIGAGFQRELIDSVMRFGGKRAALAGLEIHHVACLSSRLRGVVMRENPLAAFAQHCKT